MGNVSFLRHAQGGFAIDDYAFDQEALLLAGNNAQQIMTKHYKGKFNAYQRTYVLLFEVKAGVILLQICPEYQLENLKRVSKALTLNTSRWKS